MDVIKQMKYILNKYRILNYIWESIRLPTPPNTDPLSYISNYKRYQINIYIPELLVI